MKKQNQAPIEKGRTTENRRQQKPPREEPPPSLGPRAKKSTRDRTSEKGFNGFSCSVGGAQVIAHPELAQLIDRGPAKGRSRRNRRQPSTDRIDTSFVTINLTDAQRVQLARPGWLNTRLAYTEFLHVATHEQLLALRGSVPLYWAGIAQTDQAEHFAPKQLVALFGRKPVGTGYVWLYKWMSQARLELSTELKRRRIKPQDHAGSWQKLHEEGSITVILSPEVATAIKNGARLRLVDEKTDSFICYARASEEQN